MSLSTIVVPVDRYPARWERLVAPGVDLACWAYLQTYLPSACALPVGRGSTQKAGGRSGMHGHGPPTASQSGRDHL